MLGENGTSEGNWRDTLRQVRERTFVGRQAELAQLTNFLDAPLQRLAHVHGPGGIGKSALLQQVRVICENRGLPVRHISTVDLGTRPDDIEQALSFHEAQGVWIVDGLEHWAVLDGWLREEFLPQMPSGLRLVSAGREPLGAEWLSDPGWSKLSTQSPSAG